MRYLVDIGQDVKHVDLGVLSWQMAAEMHKGVRIERQRRPRWQFWKPVTTYDVWTEAGQEEVFRAMDKVLVHYQITVTEVPES